MWIRLVRPAAIVIALLTVPAAYGLKLPAARFAGSSNRIFKLMKTSGGESSICREETSDIRSPTPRQVFNNATIKQLDPAKRAAGNALADRFKTELQFLETSCSLRGLCFVDDQKGWAVGLPHWDQSRESTVGTILVTEDGGETWKPQNSSSETALNGIYFTDNQHGWAVGEKGTVQCTRDGGATWTLKTIDTEGECCGVFFTDSLQGCLTVTEPTHIGYMGDADDWRGSIWKTTDGGETWKKQSVPENTGILKRITFIDSDHGWAAGTIRREGPYGDAEFLSSLFVTSDGGLTWHRQFNHTLEMVMIDVEFTDRRNGWAVGYTWNSGLEGGTLFHTIDGGADWESVNQGGTSEHYLDVEFLDANRGMIVGTQYGSAWGPPVLRTIDGGVTWQKVRMELHDGEGLYGLAVSPSRILAVGDRDYTAWSSLPWDASPQPEKHFSQKYINAHYRFEDVFFIDALNGWVVGSRICRPEFWNQAILHTDDGGLTWEMQFERAPDPRSSMLSSLFRLDKVHFLDTKEGWAVGSTSDFGEAGTSNEGSIYHTRDGGLHWDEQGTSLGPTELFSVQFLDGRNGWAVSDGLFGIRFARTEDAGENWRWVETGVDRPLIYDVEKVMGDISFCDPLNGWVAGGLGTLMRTTDGGVTWKDLSLDGLHFRRFLAVQFLDRSNGWIVGEGLFHTADGGETWSIVPLPVDGLDFHDIQFTDNRRGWIAGDGGVILMTDDGGDSWIAQQSGDLIPADLKGLSFVNDSTGWACGHSGAILKITGGRDASGVAEGGKERGPVRFGLHPSYPNPFNGSTVLRFELDRTAFVRLRVFDALGREAADLVRGVQPAGVHRAQWNPTGLPSGLYIGRIEVSDPASPGLVSGMSTQKLLFTK